MMSSAHGDFRVGRPRQSEHVVSNRLGEAGVLVHLLTNQIFELNATGVRLWELLGEGQTLDEIVRTLEAEFDVDEARVRDEVSALVEALARQGLIDVGDAR